jgi:hypothetical protein
VEELKFSYTDCDSTKLYNDFGRQLGSCLGLGSGGMNYEEKEKTLERVRSSFS